MGLLSASLILLNLSVGAQKNEASSILCGDKYRGYLQISTDTAYFKFRQFDKPSYFTAFDTLIRKNDTLYQSATKDLIIKDKCYYLFLKNASKEKKIDFHSANAKELRRWNYAHNIDEINRHIEKINERKHYYLNNNNKMYQEMKEDLDKLIDLSNKLSPNEFKIEFSNFLKQYLIDR